jgi:hypothetical protein
MIDGASESVQWPGSFHFTFRRTSMIGAVATSVAGATRDPGATAAERSDAHATYLEPKGS